VRFSMPRRRAPMLALNLATMLDATFLLLAYFIVTAAVERPEERLEALLAGPSAASASDLEPVVVEVRGEIAAPFRVGERPVKDLRAVLASLDVRTPIRVEVLDGASVALVAAALQAAEDTGFSGVSYAPGE
jgi:biopolymer transport protein ExbD